MEPRGYKIKLAQKTPVMIISKFSHVYYTEIFYIISKASQEVGKYYSYFRSEKTKAQRNNLFSVTQFVIGTPRAKGEEELAVTKLLLTADRFHSYSLV